MKKVIFYTLIAVFLLPAAEILAQKKVYVSEDVVKTAELINFKYKDELKKAKAQDAQAIIDLFEFSRILDGAEIVDHAVTCLELIPIATDKVVAPAIAKLNPSLKKASLDRLLSAQAKTEKAELKEPISAWAPYTWEALNNRQVIIPSDQPAAGATNGNNGALPTNAIKDVEQPAIKPAAGSLKPSATESREGGN